jgi:hypothetical protein
MQPVTPSYQSNSKQVTSHSRQPSLFKLFRNALAGLIASLKDYFTSNKTQSIASQRVTSDPDLAFLKIYDQYLKEQLAAQRNRYKSR